MAQKISNASKIFVNRKNEIAVLFSKLELVLTSKTAKIVLLQGDYGVGKTTLVEIFLDKVSAQNKSILISSGKCVIEKGGNGLTPFHGILHDLFENKKYKISVIAGNTLEFLKDIAPAWLDVFTAGVASAVVKTYDEGKKILTPPTVFSQENVFVQFTNLINKVAQKSPLIIFIEDLHWADASSLQLLFHISRYIVDAPLFIIGTYRPVEALETGDNAELFKDIHANLMRYGATIINLDQGLNVLNYVEQRYPNNQFSVDFLKKIQESTEGHALFVSQLFSLWEETGEVILTSNGWILRNSNFLPQLPDSISLVLDQRLRLMTDTLRETLTYASVEGEDFTAQTISQIQKLDDMSIYEHLEDLEHRYYMIREQGSKDVGISTMDFYKFAHRFFREHIYKKLSAGKLRILHKQVGEFLESVYIDKHLVSGQLANHFKEARDYLKSAGYALLAAENEQLHFAWEESEKWCQFGLACLSESPNSANENFVLMKLDLLAQSGAGYHLCGNYEQAQKQFQEALAIVQNLDKYPERESYFYERLSDICNASGSPEDTLNLIERGEKTLLENFIPFNEAALNLKILRSVVDLKLGKNEQAVKSLFDILDQSDNLSDDVVITRAKVRISNWLCAGLSNLNRYQDFMVISESALHLAEKLDDKNLIVTNLITLVDDYLMWSDRIIECEQYLQRAIQLADQIGDQKNLARARGIMGAVFLKLDHYEEAQHELLQAIALNDTIGVSYNQPYFYMFLSLTQLSMRNFEESYQSALRAVSLSENKDHMFWGLALDALAQSEFALLNWDMAKEHFEQSISIQSKEGSLHGVALTQLHYAKMLISKKEIKKASELLESAQSTFARLNLTRELRETQQLLQSTN